jgi:signal transduction histidine kinase
MVPPLLAHPPVDSREQHDRELEKLARARLPLAVALLLAFLVGALPIEAYYYPWHLRGYCLVLGVQTALSLVALIAARWWTNRVRVLATVWATVMGLCVLGYYPLVDGDATLALAAVLCVISAMPAILPFGLRHQLALCVSVTIGLIVILLMGTSSALPFPYLVVSLVAVGTLSTIGATSLQSYRLDAMQREAVLRQAHEHLRLALGRAEGAVEMRSRLVANVSHELRTPVNVIVGYADMVLDAVDDPKTVRSLVRRIRQYAVTLDSLISQLLDLSRLSCGKVELVAEPIDLARVMDEVAHDARLLTRGRPITVSASCTVSGLESDPLRLRQILNNLVTNAARATQAGRIAIDARRDGDWLVLAVSDTGCGIAPEKHAAIFDAFEQVGKQTLSESGIGLGLAIVRQLVEVLDGEIVVDSALGSGATFTVRLPAWRPPEAPRMTRDALVEPQDAESAEAALLTAAEVDAPDDAPASLAGGSASTL